MYWIAELTLFCRFTTLILQMSAVGVKVFPLERMFCFDSIF